MFTFMRPLVLVIGFFTVTVACAPGEESKVVIQGPGPFLWPSYLPEALTVSQAIVHTEQGIRLLFGDPAGQWLIIDQSWAPAGRALPEGERVQVNEQEAVLLTGQSGVEGWLGGPREPPEEPGKRPEPRKLHYKDATRLIWYAGNIRVEMLSNLDVKELLRIATSMRPQETPLETPPEAVVPMITADQAVAIAREHLQKYGYYSPVVEVERGEANQYWERFGRHRLNRRNGAAELSASITPASSRWRKKAESSSAAPKSIDQDSASVVPIERYPLKG